jgi:hypothetical protein
VVYLRKSLKNAFLADIFAMQASLPTEKSAMLRAFPGLPE